MQREIVEEILQQVRQAKGEIEDLEDLLESVEFTSGANGVEIAYDFDEGTLDDVLSRLLNITKDLQDLENHLGTLYT